MALTQEQYLDLLMARALDKDNPDMNALDEVIAMTEKAIENLEKGE